MDLATHFTAAAEPTGVRNDNREAWLALRREMVTASDVAAIMGQDPHRGALDCYVDKITARKEPEHIGLDDPRFWGTALEQPILSAVAKYHGWDYCPGGALLRSRRHPHLGATLDAEIDRHDGLGWLDFEGKTTRVPAGWSQDDGDLPTRVLVQVQAQLLVTGAPLGVVFALLQGSRPCMIEIHPDADFHAVIVEVTEEFLDRLTRLDPPDPDHTESSKRALGRLYPTDDGGVVMLPDCAVDWTRELAGLAAWRKGIDRREAEIQNLLRASIGAATWGVLPDEVDGRRYWRWKLQNRKGHVVAPSSSRVLLGMKNGPDTAKALPARPHVPELESALRESVAANAEQTKAAAPRRRRARR